MSKKTNSKLRILLVWNYERIDWVQPFLELKNEFHFIFLNKLKSKVDYNRNNIEGIDCIYWSDYYSPGSIIKFVKPNAIIFMSLAGFPDIILNSVARKVGIKTAILQHGLYFSQLTYKEKIRLSYNVQKSAENVWSLASKKWVVKYLISGIYQGLGLNGGLSMLKYICQKRRTSDVEALEKNRFPKRMPDQLLVYTKANARIFEERDGLKSSIMLEIGNPGLDRYFTQTPQEELPFKNYILLIDTPLFARSGSLKGFGFTIEEATKIYNNILAYVNSRMKNLAIKQHPYSYNEEPLISGGNVFYIKDEFTNEQLIKQADAVLSFPSTLTIPAIYLKPALLLKFGENDFLELINSRGLIPVINILELDSHAPEAVWSEKARDFIIKNYLYKADGGSTQRLAAALKELSQ